MNKKGNVGVDAHIDPKKRDKNVGAGLVSARKRYHTSGFGDHHYCTINPSRNYH